MDGWEGRGGGLGEEIRSSGEAASGVGAGLLGLVFVACVVFGAVAVGEGEDQEQRDAAWGVGEHVGEQVGELIEGGVDGRAPGAGSYG